ncbi:hypothetical protein [Paraconexibacter sp. AEG42_29]
MSTPTPRHLLLPLALAALAATGATAALATAEDAAAPPTVRFALAAADGRTAPTGPATVPPGAVRIDVATKAKGMHGFQLLRLPAGADVPAIQQRVSKARSDDDFEALGGVVAVGGTGVSARRKGSIVVDLTSGTYLLADLSSQKGVPSVPFTVGEGSGPGLPAAPAATISMFDYKYEIAGKLPRKGDVRIVNKGKRNHIVVVFKTADAKGSARLVKAVRADDQRAAGKEIRGEGTSANAVGPGQAHDLTVANAPGNYVLVCFVKSKQSKGKAHNALGMVKAVTVK